MYPSSFSTCAMDTLTFEEGTPTTVFPTIWALRMRVSMSAMGSVMLMRSVSYQLALISPGISPRSAISRSLLRARPNLRNTPRGRPVSLQRLRSRTGEAFRGSCWSCSRASWRSSSERFTSLMVASSAARRAANLATVLRRFCSRLMRASLAMESSGLEREAERGKQRPRLVVRLCSRGDGDVEPPQGVDLVVLDLRENDLFLDPEAVVAAAVEGAVRYAAEVADARDRDGHEAIEELVHALAAQRHHAAHREILAHLEGGDRFLRLGDHRLLPGDLGEVGHGVVQDLLVLGGLAHAHVERDLADSRHLHRRLVAELLHQLGNDVLAVILLQSGHFRRPP